MIDSDMGLEDLLPQPYRMIAEIIEAKMYILYVNQIGIN